MSLECLRRSAPQFLQKRLGFLSWLASKQQFTQNFFLPCERKLSPGQSRSNVSLFRRTLFRRTFCLAWGAFLLLFI